MGYLKNKVQTHTFLWDFDSSNRDANSSTATGVIPIFSAPAKCLIMDIKADVQTAVTGSTAEELGDGTDVDGFVADGFAANAGIYPLLVGDRASSFAGAFLFDENAGGTDALDVDNVPEQKYYASADTIDYKISGTATAGKVRFHIKFMVLQ